LKTYIAVIAMALCVAACTGANSVGAKTAKAQSCTAGKAAGTSDAALPQVMLCIKSGKSTHSFTTEIAATGREQAMGLMFRKSLADDAAMIFPFARPRQASFWMKNTLIPLDIIFVRSDGSIESIAQNTVPYSEDPVASGEEVAAVLEVRGGLTRELGIKAGDVVLWK
jgi:uncharacterized protein